MQSTHKLFSRRAFGAALVSAALAFAPVAAAQQVVDEIHFLIPGGAGGGWDGTARGTGEALTKAGIVGNATYENMSGGGGGKAIAHLIETAEPQSKVLMVNSTPIVFRSLQKIFPQSFRDLTPVAGIIGDYAAFGVKTDSPLKTFNDLVDAYKKDPRSVSIGGGSQPGSMDHFVPAMVFKKVGADPKAVKYVPYDAGGKALAGLLSGEIDMLSSGLSEMLELERQGEIRILAITAPERTKDAPGIPTLREQGIDVTFVNWRGFFGPPGLSEAKKQQYIAALEKMYNTPEWEEVRARNSWVKIYNPDDKFVSFLEEQEQIVGGILRDLGFL